MTDTLQKQKESAKLLADDNYCDKDLHLKMGNCGRITDNCFVLRF